MERRVLRKTAVDLCASCKNQGQQGCKKSEIDSSRGGKVTLPICMTDRLGEIRIGQKNIFEYCTTTEPEPEPEPEPKSETKQKPESGWKGFFEAVIPEPEPELRKEQNKTRTVPLPTIRTVECTDAPLKNWDEMYTKILYCIKDHHTIGSMSKVLKLPRSTIRDRLTNLEKKEIITKSETTLLGNRCANFIITSGWALKLVNQGEPQIIINKPGQPKHESVKFTRHNVSLQAEIISGEIPKGDRSYSPNGWTGEIFEGNGTYKIRVIPNRNGTARAVIDIFVSLGASSPADLTMRYHAFAERYLGAWSEKHSLKLSQITEYRTPHTAIEGSKGLAQTILNAVGGETKIKDKGVQVDKSDKEHKGEIEFHGTKKEGDKDNKGEEALRNFDFALNQSPQKMEQLASKFDALRDTLHNEVEKVGNGLSGIQGFLILQRENDLLREQVQLYREQLAELTKQVNEMKAILGLVPAHPGAKKNKYDEVGIYG